MYRKWGKTKLIGSRIITMEFDYKRFWKFTTALGSKLSDGRLFFFYKIISDSAVYTPIAGVKLLLPLEASRGRPGRSPEIVAHD